MRAGIENLIAELSNLIEGFSEEQMPGARRGANIYDVESRWEATPEVSITEAKEKIPSARSLSDRKAQFKIRRVPVG